MTAPSDSSRPLLVIVSDRPFVWVGFRSPDREVRRWIGERESDEERASPMNFAGDPTDPDTYRWTEQSPDLSAVVDLQDQERAAGAIDALRRTRPEAAVLVITANDEFDAPAIEISRRLAWTDALRGDLEGELRQLEALRRLTKLRTFAEGDGDVAIVVHPDPDPDALASALALRALLRRDRAITPIVTVGAMRRPENRRMAELLEIRVTVITEAELQKLERLIAVDCQPCLPDTERVPRLAIIDHHPYSTKPVAEFSDVRPQYGATATMLTEYMRLDDEERIGEQLATALLYGIKTDTDSLVRGCIPADVEAYAFLQNRADLPLLRRLERPSYSVATAHSYGAALTGLALDGDLAVAFLGPLAEADKHVLVDIADFCLGLDAAIWAVAGALTDGHLELAIRHLDNEPGAGELAKSLIASSGSGGGHASMARATIPIGEEWQDMLVGTTAEVSNRLSGLIRNHLERLHISPRSSRPARQAKAPSATTG